jgi:hypothetical protein
MDRRGFMGMMIGGVAVAAAVRQFPFRVYSFPAKIEIADRLWVQDIRTGKFYRANSGNLHQRGVAIWQEVARDPKLQRVGGSSLAAQQAEWTAADLAELDRPQPRVVLTDYEWDDDGYPMVVL